VLRELFPEPAEPVPRRVPRSLPVLLLAAAIPLGVLVMLVRVAGTTVPPWDSIYGEDLSIFLIQALQHPWPLLVSYAGYLQLVPRLIAQFVVYLPLRDAAAAFAISGALVTTGCALFIFHASAGHVRSAVLRFVLALAVVLLPVAQLEIADSGVNCPWYLLFALFWAVLWRPGTRAGMAGAAAVGFLTAASTTMSVLFAPLLLARVIALPRLREHAVTAGWAAGCLLQVPYVVSNLGSAQSRAAHRASPGQVLAFYGHEVVLPALGWHLAWRLQAFAGRNGATLIIGAILVVVFGWALLTQRGQARVFVVASLITGFLCTAFGATLKSGVTTSTVTENFESGSRYTALPIFLIEAAAVVAAGSFICPRQHRLRTVAAVTALVGVLSVGWVTDFRYPGWRGGTINWPSTATAWLHACQRTPDGVIRVPTGASFNGAKTAIPCASLRRLCRAARSRGGCRERAADPPGGRSGWRVAARPRRPSTPSSWPWPRSARPPATIMARRAGTDPGTRTAPRSGSGRGPRRQTTAPHPTATAARLPGPRRHPLPSWHRASHRSPQKTPPSYTQRDCPRTDRFPTGARPSSPSKECRCKARPAHSAATARRLPPEAARVKRRLPTGSQRRCRRRDGGQRPGPLEVGGAVRRPLPYLS